MLIIGCDYHPGFQQIAFVDTETGECGERRLAHREEAEQLYRELKERNLPVRVGMESSGHSRWFERLLRDLRFHSKSQDRAKHVYNRCRSRSPKPRKGGPARMNWKRLILGVVTALAMMAATYILPRGSALRDASLAQFPMTVGVWAIFVLLFVKLK